MIRTSDKIEGKCHKKSNQDELEPKNTLENFDGTVTVIQGIRKKLLIRS